MRDQIAQDRAERNARFMKEKQTRIDEELKQKEEREAAKIQELTEQEKERQKIARIQVQMVCCFGVD